MDNAQNTRICSHCGQQLEPVVFYLHPQAKQDLDWLVNLRVEMSSEQDLSDVLDRLIQLEVTKRKNIEERKRKK